jgi:hypothetical protein
VGVRQHLPGLAYRRYLGMGGRVAIKLCPVTSPGNNFAIVNHDSAKRGASIVDRLDGVLNGFPEKGFVCVVGRDMAHVQLLLIVGSCSLRLAKLAVLAASPIETDRVGMFFFMGRLAVDAQPDSGNSLAPGLWNRRPALIAFLGTFACAQLAACTLDFIFNTGIDLFLHRAIS